MRDKLLEGEGGDDEMRKKVLYVIAIMKSVGPLDKGVYRTLRSVRHNVHDFINFFYVYCWLHISHGYTRHWAGRDVYQAWAPPSTKYS
jgi:hypothetical protein